MDPDVAFSQATTPVILHECLGYAPSSSFETPQASSIYENFQNRAQLLPVTSDVAARSSFRKLLVLRMVRAAVGFHRTSVKFACDYSLQLANPSPVVDFEVHTEGVFQMAASTQRPQPHIDFLEHVHAIE